MLSKNACSSLLNRPNFQPHLAKLTRVGSFAALWMALAAAMMGAGCSPYVYRAEIGRFSDGVRHLTSAYTTGLEQVADDRTDRLVQQWRDGRARLVLTEGCVLSVAASPQPSGPCALREAGQPVPAPLATETQAAAAAPIVTALGEYAAALAAVANAEDRQALDAAQASLKQAVTALATRAGATSTVEFGAVADLVALALGAALDARRYEVLRDGVLAAKDPVSTLGRALGETLDALRAARARELQLTATRLSAGLGPRIDGATYAARLDALRARVATLEALRRTDPRQAAADMVAAHEALARALADRSRQAQAVADAVKAFVEKARAVGEAFASGRSS